MANIAPGAEEAGMASNGIPNEQGMSAANHDSKSQPEEAHEAAEGVETCVHDLIAKQIRKRASNPAVCTRETVLTYSELGRLSARLAHYLSSLGVKPEDHVCFSFEKSILPVLGMLAILQAGGACVPLDIAYPSERIKTIVQSCKAQFILCSRQQSIALQEMITLTEIDIKLVPVDWDVLSRLPDYDGPACATVRPSNVCWTIFTSGSTGVPKGCMWEHRMLCMSALAHGEAMFIGPTSRVFQFSAFIWDVSVCEAITTLIHGGCVCVPDEERRLTNTVQVMDELQVTWAWLTPSFTRLISLEEARTLRTLVLGGEVIGQDNVDRLRKRFQLLTGYGPTECWIVSVADFTANPSFCSGNIGPAVGSQMYITDPQDPHVLVPDGVVGEIVVGGSAVGRGYVRDPERTMVSFPTDLRFAKRSAQPTNAFHQFYRTGDLGRLRDDGTFEYVGRSDSMVKIRGMRLQLDEVEYHLCQCEFVKIGVTLHPSSGPFKDKLVAVFSPTKHPADAEAVDDTVELSPFVGEGAWSLKRSVEAFLAVKLPNYAVPNVFIAIQALPHTLSRKVDRSRIEGWLLRMDRETAGLVSSWNDVQLDSQPPTALEMQLVKIWAEVLEISQESVSRSTSFLAMGGDSITAIRISSKCRAVGLPVTVQALMRDKTILKVAMGISLSEDATSADQNPGDANARNSEMHAKEHESLLPQDGDVAGAMASNHLQVDELGSLSVHASERKAVDSNDTVDDTYPCALVQEGMLMAQLRDPGKYTLDSIVKVSAKESSAPLQVHRIIEAWQAVVRRHGMLRTIFIENLASDQLFYQVVLKEHNASVLRISASSANEAVDKLDHIKLRRSANEPPHCLTVCEVSDANLVYCKLEISHACIDATSLDILWRDLGRAYASQQLSNGTTSFGIHAVYMKQHCETMDAEGYWQTYLKQMEACHFPPMEGATRAETNFEVVDIPFTDAGALNSFCRAHDITTSTVVRTAWAVLLSVYCAQSAVSFGEVSTLRDLPGVSTDDVVGPFMNLVPRRADVMGGATLHDVLQHSHADFVASLQHHFIPLNRVLNKSPNPNASLFNTILSVWPSALDVDSLGGCLDIEQVSLGDPTEVGTLKTPSPARRWSVVSRG